MPSLPFTPPLQAVTLWRRHTTFHARQTFPAGGRFSEWNLAYERLLARLPGADLWLAALRGHIGVHWAFWVLFMGPLVIASLVAQLMSGWGVVALDASTVVWMGFAFHLVWRCGLGHTGWSASPILYRAVMLFFLLPAVVILAGAVM